jgi:predicted nuclease with TOPRIM domain
MLAEPLPPDYDMPVQPASLEILERADVPPAQARAIVQAIEIEMAGAKETLATRQDFLILRHETSQLGTELRHEMAEMRTELRHEMQELGTKLELRVSGLESSLESRLDSRFSSLEPRFSGLETRFSGLEPRFSSLESRFSSLDTRLARVETRMDSLVTQRQLYGALLGQMAVLLGIAYFFVVHVSR